MTSGRVAWMASTSIIGMMQAYGFAHEGLLATPHDLWRSWNISPLPLAGLLVLAFLYARGTLVLWKRGGVGRGVHPAQVIAFAGGLLTLLVAFVSPLDALSTVLFSAHMLQHLLLIMVAAPLLVIGAPLLPLLWALPKRVRHGAAQLWLRAGPLRRWLHALQRPWSVWCLYALTLWLWHLPKLYQQALRNAWLHELEHLSLLLAAGLFWWAIVQPLGRRQLGFGLGVLFIFTTALHSSGLGALLTFAQAPLYPFYERALEGSFVSPLEDQQLAGLLMWLPPNFLYTVVVICLVTLFLREKADDR